MLKTYFFGVFLKRKIRRVTVFYWLISITLVSWCFAMLYIYSWRSSWAGKVVLEETIRKEERSLRQRIAILEEMAAPDRELAEARINLAKVLMQSGEYNNARYALDEAEGRLIVNKTTSELQSVLLERLMINKLAAVVCRDSGLYQFAQDRYEKIDKLMAPAKKDPELQYIQVVLLNDKAVLHYIWANSSKDLGDRRKHFNQAQALFKQSVELCQHYIGSESDKFKNLEAVCKANLSELKNDLL